MSYPDYPNNRLIVGGVDLTTEYQMILVDGYTLNPPAPKTYVVNIPGGNGKLDLTESLLGDTAYDNRSQEFIFYLINPDDFEHTKTLVSNFLHGKAFDYMMTMDQGYTYHGRFSVSSYEHSPSSMGKIGVIKISIDSDPFKYKVKQERIVSGIAGRIYTFDSGRKSVRPTFEIGSMATIEYNGNVVELPVGNWTIEELFFHCGDNPIYVNTYRVRSITWDGLKTTHAVTWGGFKANRLFEWYKIDGIGNVEYDQWSSVQTSTWSGQASNRWVDKFHLINPPYNISDVKVKYDWGDL